MHTSIQVNNTQLLLDTRTSRTSRGTIGTPSPSVTKGDDYLDEENNNDKNNNDKCVLLMSVTSVSSFALKINKRNTNE